MANIYDVARLAKVSTTTVSKVLSNTPYVSAKTRQRVLDAMKQLHYSPSLAARGLTHNRTYVIGLIVPHDADFSFRDAYILGVMCGVDAVAIDHDYNVLLSMTKKQNRLATYDRFLRMGYVDGIVTIERYKGQIAENELAEHSIPRVSAGYREDLQDINSVHSADRQGAYEAMKHLLSLNHQRIGIISGPPYYIATVDERLQGIHDALAESGLTLDSCLVAYGDFDTESGYAAATSLLAQKDRPTAIFAMNDRMALGALYKARELGLSVPDMLSLVGFDDLPLASYLHPPLTTVRQFPEEIGRVAAQHLFSLINHEFEQFESVTLPVELVVRNSTAPLR